MVAGARLICSDTVLRKGFKQERSVRCVFRTGGRGRGHSGQRQQLEERHGDITVQGRFGTGSSHPPAPNRELERGKGLRDKASWQGLECRAKVLDERLLLRRHQAVCWARGAMKPRGPRSVEKA